MDFERLKTVGYGVVKALLCTELFLRAPPLSPKAMTDLVRVIKDDAAVAATRLGACAVQAGLHLFLNTERPSHGRWTRAGRDELRRDVSLDVLGDALKAVLGAFFLGPSKDSTQTAAPTLAAAQWLRLLPADEHDARAVEAVILRGSDAQDAAPAPQLSAAEEKIVKIVEEGIGYAFKDKRLLLQALTPKHASESNYERLEFLGDAVLEAIAARGVFRAHPRADCGQLTVERVAIVEHKGLSTSAVRSQLHRALLEDDDARSDSARRLSSEQRRQLLGYLAGAFPREARRYGYEGPAEAEAPKVLSDVFEALLAAVMLEGGLDMASVVGWAMLSRPDAAPPSPAT